MIRKPRPLPRHATLALVAPASPVRDHTKLERGIRYLESLGHRCIVGSSIQQADGYLAGSDDQRARELMDFFTDPRIDAILCVRGGYGTMRLLDRLDWEVLARNPKIFVGFSDTTALQWALLARAGLPSLSGFLVGVDFDAPEPSSEALFWSLLHKPVSNLVVWQGTSHDVLTLGTAEGTLLAGTLTLVAALCGTPYLPAFNSTLLVLEDIGEEPYRIDRMLCQLHLAGVFARCAGVALGIFTEDQQRGSSTPRRPLQTILREYADRMPSTPICWNLPYGHIRGKMSLPIGIRARLDADNAQLILVESFVE